MEKTNFDQWAVIEVFGHEQYAGRVTSQTIGSNTMIELTVPSVSTNGAIDLPPFTKLFNPTSIFSITPVTEEYALNMAKKLRKQPIAGFNHQEVIKSLAQKAFEEMKHQEIQKLVQRELHFQQNETKELE